MTVTSPRLFSRTASEEITHPSNSAAHLSQHVLTTCLICTSFRAAAAALVRKHLPRFTRLLHRYSVREPTDGYHGYPHRYVRSMSSMRLVTFSSSLLFSLFYSFYSLAYVESWLKEAQPNSGSGPSGPPGPPAPSPLSIPTPSDLLPSHRPASEAWDRLRPFARCRRKTVPIWEK